MATKVVNRSVPVKATKVFKKKEVAPTKRGQNSNPNAAFGLKNLSREGNCREKTKEYSRGNEYCLP